MKKYILLTFILLHLLLIFLSNGSSAFESYCENHEPEQGVASKTNKKIKAVVGKAFSCLWLYDNYSGINANYCFFAPNVASEFVVAYYVKDSVNSRERTLGAHMMPPFKRKESELRFQICYAFMQKRLMQKKPGGILTDYITIMLRQISLHIKKPYKGAGKVYAKSYLHVQPKIEEYAQGKRQYVVMLDEFEFFTHIKKHIP